MTVRKNQATLTANEKRALRRRPPGAQALRAVRHLRHHAQRVHHERHRQRRPRRPPLAVVPALAPPLPHTVRAGPAVPVDATVTLPYWDWTADRTSRSSLWAPDFLGGTGRVRDGQVTDGPFARTGNRWTINVRVDGRDYLRRDLGAGGRQLPTRAEVDSRY
ncbi:tyrosinase family protein [Streptomyces tanashiensis]